MDFKILNSVGITKGSDNGDSDSRGSTVYNYTTATHEHKHKNI